MWNILGIEPTKDIKAIKAAYAKLAKQYNPEEHPEEFKRIFDAYKSACAYARSKNTPEPQKPDTTQEGLNLSFAPKQEQSQSQENAFDFSNLNENAKPKPQMEDKKEDNALDFSSVDERLTPMMKISTGLISAPLTPKSSIRQMKSAWKLCGSSILKRYAAW